MPNALPAQSTGALTRAALNPVDQWWQRIGGDAARSAARLLDAESASGRHQRSVYELFAEMDEKDAHLHAVLSTRINGLLALPRNVSPRGDNDQAREAAALVADAFDHFPRFDELLRTLLDSIAKGFAVVELIWDYDTRGRLLPVDWIAHPQEYFLFGDRGELLLLCPPFQPSGNGLPAAPDVGAASLAGRSLLPAHDVRAAPPRKFIVLHFDRDARNPYGRGLAQRAYWYYRLKKDALRSWSIFNERYGAPTAVATCDPNTTDEERRRVLDVLGSIQAEAGIVVPETIRIDLLQGHASGSGATYRELVDWCNDEISKLVLGQTLTTGEGRRSGSLALGNVHEIVRHDYIESDARMLCGAINNTLARWIVELNCGYDDSVPVWSIDTTPPEDLELQVRIDRELLHLGVSLPVSYFYQRYGRPVPSSDEFSLIYDDANLFQYHLRHGVLTINEVRQRLHLPPVEWGDRRTLLEREFNEGDGDPDRANCGPSQEERSAGEAPAERAERRAEREGAEA